MQREEEKNGPRMVNTMAGRTVLAVLASYLALAIMVGMTERFLSLFVRTRGGTPSLSYYVLDLIGQLFYTFLAGYFCHRIAPTHAIALGGLIGIGFVVGTVSLVTSWNREPHWYASGLLASYAPCVWTGWALRGRIFAKSKCKVSSPS